MSEVQKTKPSNIMKILDVFQYGGARVVVRRWDNCYEYLLVHHGELFCDYVQYGKKGKEPNERDLKGIIDHLRSGAVQTIDWHNEQRSVKHKFITLCANAKKQLSLKPKA